NVVLSELMFPSSNPTWAQIKTWAVFATGFVVRPFGALVFGRIGDLIGRKYAFLVTLSIMWLSTFLMGATPPYATIGVAALLILLSVVLVGMSLYIRLRLQESPLFAALKRGRQTSAAPLKESFAKWSNLKIVLLVLFGATAGQGIVWYTGQFYALSFLQTT